MVFRWFSNVFALSWWHYDLIRRLPPSGPTSCFLQYIVRLGIAILCFLRHIVHFIAILSLNPYGFPMVFLCFRPGPVALYPHPSAAAERPAVLFFTVHRAPRHRDPLFLTAHRPLHWNPIIESQWFSYGFPMFSPWSGGIVTSSVGCR